jgi:hypothetical protein
VIAGMKHTKQALLGDTLVHIAGKRSGQSCITQSIISHCTSCVEALLLLPWLLNAVLILLLLVSRHAQPIQCI